MICLGLDIGSSSIKGAVLDLDREHLGPSRSCPFPDPLPGLPPGWFEIAPQAVVRQVTQLLGALCDAAPNAAAIYFSGQMGGVILVNEAGEPLTNYLSWRDQRTLGPRPTGGSYLDAIRDRWEGELLVSLGNELQPGSLSSLVFWLSEQGQLPPGAIPLSIADYVIGQLCRSSPQMHVTHAIGLLDLRSSSWHLEAFDRIGVKSLRWPELIAGVEPSGQFTVRGRHVNVFGAYGDQQCALRGAGLQRGELSLNISTGSQVSRRSTRFQPGRYQTRRYFDGDWLDTITHLPAGRSLNVLFDLVTELAGTEEAQRSEFWNRIVEEATAAQPSELQVDLSFFAGPLGRTGGVYQITTENLTVGQLFHAAFRTMADNYAHCAAWLDPEPRWESVVLSGGLSQAVPLLRQLIQSRFDAPIRESVGDDTLSGLLSLARKAELQK